MNTNQIQNAHITIPGGPALGSPHGHNIGSHTSSNHLKNYVDVEKKQVTTNNIDDIIAVFDEDANKGNTPQPAIQVEVSANKSSSPKPIPQKAKKASPKHNSPKVQQKPAPVKQEKKPVIHQK